MKTYQVTDTVPLSGQVEIEIATYDVISDGAARAIAQWYHSPAPADAPFLQLGQGTEFDVMELSERMERAGMYPSEYRAMRDWVDSVWDRVEE